MKADIYYNEIDGHKIQWMKNMMSTGALPKGDIDDRSIEDVTPNDLDGYTQCHFFAGIGIWSMAIRDALWPRDVPVWTGSCPCQPFSKAGKGVGFADKRHLWPSWFHNISECRPDEVFIEQVADNNGLSWLDTVQSDMEATGYAGGAINLCACGFGAPHIRQRLFGSFRLGYTDHPRLERRQNLSKRQGRRSFGADSMVVGLAGSPHGNRLPSVRGDTSGSNVDDDAQSLPDKVNGFWRNADWLHGYDGYWRCVEPGAFPLADGFGARRRAIHAYGDAIVLPQATEFIKGVMST